MCKDGEVGDNNCGRKDVLFASREVYDKNILVWSYELVVLV